VRAHGVLGDEQSLGDLVRPKVLVEEQQDFDFTGRELLGDRVRDAAETTVLADAVEEPACDASRERGVPAHDAAEECGDLLRRLGLEQVPGRPCANRGEEVLLRVRRGQNDDLAGRCLFPDPRKRREPVHSGHRQIQKHDVGRVLAGGRQRLFAVRRFAYDLEPLLGEQGSERVARQRMVVDDQDPFGHEALIGRTRAADKSVVDQSQSQVYRSWLLGELLVVALLASATALFASSESLQSAYALPEARLAFDSTVAVVAVIVAVLSTVRFLVDGRRLDLLLAGGFWSISLGTVAFGLVPVLGGGSLPPASAWSLVAARVLGAALIALAPFTHERLQSRRRSLVLMGVGVVWALAGCALFLRELEAGRNGSLQPVEGSSVVLAALVLATLWLVALVGFALRYRRYGRDLDSWMCLAATLALFAELHLVVTPIVSSEYVLQGDFLRLLAYGILLVGVWRAMAEAEFGRAVADERARVAREIHDGLAQYLFAISTQVSMLESGAPIEQVLPRLKHASMAAQQEARFAVLALSSAGGSARFDAALRRYVDVLTSDGELEVELDVDPGVRLAPDEQIEVFRIVQEGLGNARRHADARRVDVAIWQRNGRRTVTVTDDGVGFEHDAAPSGQGLANMKLRAEAIEGRLSLHSAPGRGTAIEVVLRPI
jgi:signal transduction histidine kinase